MSIEVAYHPILTRTVSALLTAALALSASLSPPMVEAAPRWSGIEAVHTAALATTSAANTAEASPDVSTPKDLARELDTIAAELRRLRPYGSDAPSLSRVLAGVGEMNPHNISQRIRARIAELGDIEVRVRDDWQRELDDMAARGIDPQLQEAHRAGLNEFLTRAVQFRALLADLDAPATRENTQATANSLMRLADFFAEQQSDRTYRAIDKALMPIRFADGKRTPAPVVTETAGTNAGTAANDPPTNDDLAQTIDIQFTPAIQALATELGNPVAIRNWVYNNIKFTPTWGSIQGADLTLLNRVGNAHDIASLTIALLRQQGVPARYVKSVVELPIDRVRNWLGNLDTPGMAVEMMQNGGIPTGMVVSGGSIVAVRFEHVWVEAWLDFIPSRGALNRVPDQWVPFDVAFKQYEYQTNSNWRQTTFAPKRQQLFDQFVQDVTVDATGGISGFNFDRVTDTLEGMAEQLASQITAQNPTLKGDYLYPTRSIVPMDARVFAGTLPFPLRSQTVLRYSTLPDTQRHVVRLAFFADESSLRFESPTREAIIPLAQIGSQRLRVEYEGSSAADRAALQSYADSNAESLPIGSISVTPKLSLGDSVLFTGNSGRMGTQHFWTAVLRNAHGQELSGEPYRFAAGSTIAFVPNHAGFSAERLEREHATGPDRAYLPTAEALHLGAEIYWALHDHLDEQAVLSLEGHVLRMPSFGAFAQPYEVRYFFGVPRTGWQPGRVTDVKLVNAAMALKQEGNRKFAALQIGAGGSMAEGASWNILSGTTYRSIGLSAATLLARAIDEGQRIFQIDETNVNVALQQLQLYVDAENEIRQAAQQGLIIIAHEREISQSGWSGSGYVIYNPFTNGSLQRVEGGFAGGIEWGCLAVAVSLKILCDKKFFKLAKEWLERIARRAGARLLANAAVMAFLGPAGAAIGITLAILSAVELAIAVAYATMEVSRWVKGIMSGTETLTPEELAELGIKAVNEVACSYMPPCLGGFPGFGGGAGGLGGGDSGSDSRGAGGPMAGNPVAIGTGAKWQVETDYQGYGRFPLQFVRTYNSQTPKHGSFIGTRWHATYFQRLDLPPNAGGELFPVEQRPESVLLWRPDGSWYQFDFRNGTYLAQSNVPGRLQRLVEGERTTGWTYTTTQDVVETYDPWGRLLTLTDSAGLTQTVHRDALMRVDRVTDPYGRELEFDYNDQSGYLASITDPAGRVVELDHDEDLGNLIRVTYPDNTTRKYLYEDLSNQYGLTAIIDERDIRTSSWTYDSLGRVKTAERASGIERYTFDYDKDQTRVTDALGTTRTYEYARIHDRPYLKKVTEPCASCGAGTAAETIYNAQGLITAKIDFEGNRTNYAYNSRGLLEIMTEAAGTPQARVTRRVWAADKHLPTQITEPVANGDRVTSLAYDPFGNLRTKRVQVGSETRIWTYTWQNGLLAGVDGPRTDVNDTITYTYDPAGNLTSKTDPSGHVTRYVEYDENGLLQTLVDPNGLESKYRYDERYRLESIEIGPENTGPYLRTEFRYNRAGSLSRIVNPDGSFHEFTYNGANQLTEVRNAAGERITYVLDGLGNRRTLTTLNSANQEVRKRKQGFDALNRLEFIEDAYGRKMNFRFDSNGNEESVTDANLSAAQSDYDSFERLERIQDALGRNIALQYDPQDNISRLVDVRNLATGLNYNGYSELTRIESPDSGITINTFDANGNLATKTDGRGQTVQHRYDQANRLIKSEYADELIDREYDSIMGGAGRKGRLTAEISTPVGTASNVASNQTRYQYDVHGRVIAKTQQVGTNADANRIKHVSYSYDAAGRHDQHVLPSGAVVGYRYGADGRVLTITVNGQTLVTDVEYHAFGGVASWRYSGHRYQRQFDLNGRITRHSVGVSERVLEYDPAGLVSQARDPNGSNWTYEYDELDRLRLATNAASTGALAEIRQAFAYDPSGNRQSSSVQRASGPITTKTLVIDSASNRLASFDGKPRQYDQSGNTIRWTAESGDNAGQVLEASYSARNRLVATTRNGQPVTTQAFNPRGERVAVWNVSATTAATTPPVNQFVYDEDGHLIGEYGVSSAADSHQAASESTIAEHIWLGDIPVAVLLPIASSHGGLAIAGNQGAPARTAYFVHPDHLDTPRAIVNASNEIVWYWHSLPFGEIEPDETPTAAEGIAGAYGSSQPFAYQLRFPGQRYDRWTGTSYNYYRDYDAHSGRYLQSDPIGAVLGGQGTYTYVLNAPLQFEDRLGLCTGGDCDNTPKPLCEWLSDRPDLLDEARNLYQTEPEWQGIDPDKTPVFYRCKDDVDAIRAQPGESGGHHPHGLALGGPPGQKLTPTNETKKCKNKCHSKATGFQRRLINAIKCKLGL